MNAPNAHSHLMHLLLSTSETIPVIDGRLALGTWQRVFMVELDGPRERQVMIRCESYHPNEMAEAVELHAVDGGVGRNGSRIIARISSNSGAANWRRA